MSVISAKQALCSTKVIPEVVLDGGLVGTVVSRVIIKPYSHMVNLQTKYSTIHVKEVLQNDQGGTDS